MRTLDSVCSVLIVTAAGYVDQYIGEGSERVSSVQWLTGMRRRDSMLLASQCQDLIFGSILVFHHVLMASVSELFFLNRQQCLRSVRGQ